MWTVRHPAEETMRYLCLIYLEETKLNALSESDYDALAADSLAYDDELRRSGHFVVSDALQPVESATTLRVRNGHLSITDGPFAETKEQLGGFILIQARDLNEAIHVASRIPPGRLGSIEVRPVQELAQQDEINERSTPCK
jgi:hypothetical protein